VPPQPQRLASGPASPDSVLRRRPHVQAPDSPNHEQLVNVPPSRNISAPTIDIAFIRNSLWICPPVIENELTVRTSIYWPTSSSCEKLNATATTSPTTTSNKRPLGLSRVWRMATAVRPVDCRLARLQGRRMLEVGCACAAFCEGWAGRGHRSGVSICASAMIQLGVQKWPDMAPLLSSATAVNLHPVQRRQLGRPTSAQVRRALETRTGPVHSARTGPSHRPGGLFFCAFDTANYSPGKRTMETRRPHARLHQADELVA